MGRKGLRSWQDSMADLNEDGLYLIGRSGLALEGVGSTRSLPPRRQPVGSRIHSVQQPRRTRARTASLLSYLVAPWLAPVHHRYQTGNRPLMRLLEWVTAKTWPLAFLDEQCRWFEEGSAGSRIFVGSLAAGAALALLTLPWAALYKLQSITWQPVFAGHGVPILVAASFLIGITILPAVLGHVLGTLLRLYVLINVCTVAALIGYVVWLLYSAARS